MAKWPWLKLKDTRGSVLVAGLMLVIVMTLLGVALFEMGLFESRLVLGTICDHQAYETAQAGISRTLRLLQLDLTADSDGDPSWADGDPALVTTALFADFPGLTDQSFADGTYSVEVKNLTRLEANSDIGVSCDADDDTSPCKDLIYVRATGNCTQGTITSTRTIQLVAGANNNAPFAGGVVTGGPASGSAISGNALVAGSLHIACAVPPCTGVVSFSGSSGVRNNYNDMSTNLQDRVPPLQLVTCPTGSICAGQQVESLGAVVQAAEPQIIAAINLSGNASLGESSSGNNPYTGQLGKPSVDDVLIGDGCDNHDCSDTVGGNAGASNVYSDNPIKPYGAETSPPFPRLDDEVTIYGVTYQDYAACPSAGNCDSAAASDFFIAHAFKIVAATEVDEGPNKQCPTPGPGKVCNLFNIVTERSDLPPPQQEKWDHQTPSFTKTFDCGAQCDDDNMNRVNGLVNGSTPPVAIKIAWDGPGQLLTIYQCPIAPCDPGPPDINWQPLSHPTQPVRPALFYVDGSIKICEGCNNKTFFYQGHAIFLAQGDIAIDPSLLTYCPACPDHDSFPQKNLLTFLTPGNIDMGFRSNRDMIGLFYAGGQWSSSKQTNVVGAITAESFDMGNQVPKFFQVRALTGSISETIVPVSAQRWSVTTSKWKECQGTVTSSPC